MANELRRFMQRVGGGPSSGKHLSFDDAQDAMRRILAGAYHPATLGAFLMALRWKGESVDELAGFTAALRADALERTGGLPEPIPGLVDVGGNYDGKRRSALAMLAGALIAAGAAVPVLLHDGSEIPTKRATTKYHVCAALGVPVDLSPHEVAESLRRCGIGFLHAPRSNPGLHALLPLRQELGKRSLFNAIESLINPLGATVHVGGFFHIAYGERLCRAATRAGVGWERVIMVQGSEGVDEMRLGRAHMAEWREGTVQTGIVESGHLGLHAEPGELPVELSTLWTEELVRGGALGSEESTTSVPSAFRDAALLNAGLLIYAGGRAASLAEGIEVARESLASGEAARVLERWRQEAFESEPAPSGPAALPYAERVGWRGPLRTYPLFLIGLERRRCVVVGGGSIAREKVEQLLAGGAGRVDIISPQLDPGLATLVDDERVHHWARPYQPGDLSGAHLVIAGTDDPRVNRRVFEEAEERGILVNVVDDPPHCHFIVPAQVRRGALHVAVATGGASPALAARLRQQWERELSPAYGDFVELAGELRPLIMDTIAEAEERRRIGYALVDAGILELLQKGDRDAARERALAIIQSGRDEV